MHCRLYQDCSCIVVALLVGNVQLKMDPGGVLIPYYHLLASNGGCLHAEPNIRSVFILDDRVYLVPVLSVAISRKHLLLYILLHVHSSQYSYDSVRSFGVEKGT